MAYFTRKSSMPNWPVLNLRFWYLSHYAQSHSLNMHVQLSSGARQVKFDLMFHLLSYLCVRAVEAVARMRRYAGLWEPSLLTYVMTTKISCAGLY